MTINCICYDLSSTQHLLGLLLRDVFFWVLIIVAVYAELPLDNSVFP